MNTIIRIATAAALAALTPLPAYAQQKTKSQTSIHAAAKAGDTDGLKAILDADPEAWKLKDVSDDTALHIAAWEGHLEAVTLLLDRGADIEIRGSFAWTALHSAARGGHVGVCRLLLERGADRHSLNGSGQTPAQITRSAAVKEVLENVEMTVPGLDQFLADARKGNVEALRQWLDQSTKLLDARDALGRTAAMVAAAEGHTEVLRLLIDRGADINLLSSGNSASALSLAASGGHLDAVRLLVEHGAEVNPAVEKRSRFSTITCSPLSGAANTVTLTETGARAMRTVFQSEGEHSSGGAAANDDPKSVLAELQLQSGEPTFGEFLSSWFRREPEPLRASKRAIVALLLKAGADPNGKYAQSPLGEAALSGDTDTIRLLLEHGADPNRILTITTALGTAAIAHAPDAAIQLLLEAGADPLVKPADTPNAVGVSPIEFATKMSNESAFNLMFASLKPDALPESAHYQTLKAVVFDPALLRKALAAGFNAKAVGGEKMTALHRAAHGTNVESLRLLLEAGADPNAPDFAGFTPLHNAAEEGRATHIPLLLEHGAEIEAKTAKGIAPLQSACGPAGSVETVRLLLEAGAMVGARSTEGSTALLNAAGGGRVEIVTLLLKAGANPGEMKDYAVTALGLAARGPAPDDAPPPEEGFEATEFGTEEDYLRLAALLIEHGADVNAVPAGTTKGYSPLEMALTSGFGEMVLFLLEHGADLELKNKTQMDRTPIQVAVLGRKQDMLDLMIERGANVNAADIQGNTPLHQAAGLDDGEMIETLLKHGAAINARNEPRATPLYHAVYVKAANAVRVLLKHGADASINGPNGLTPLELAEVLEQRELVRLLTTYSK